MMTPKERMRADVGEAARSLRHERGTAVVEFAVLLLPLALILFGILDFGRAMNYKNHLTSLANQTARYAIVNRNPASPGNPFPSCATIKSYLATQTDTAEIGDLINSGTLSITFDGSGSQTGVGRPVTVALGVDFPWIDFIATEALGVASTTLKGTATMRIEQPMTGYTVDQTC